MQPQAKVINSSPASTMGRLMQRSTWLGLVLWGLWSSGAVAQEALPTTVATRVRQDLARQLKVSPQAITITQASPQTWPDTCLGLPALGQKYRCEPLLVVGWRVKAQYGQKEWIYRTNDSGQLLAAENLRNPQPVLPETIATAVIAQAAQMFDQAPDSLEITAATPKVWSDGCLGLGGLNLLCAEQLTPGWQIIVENRLESLPQRWLYRTNQAGTQIVWDSAGSQVIGQLITPPERINPNDQPPGLEPEQLFRYIRQGGIREQKTVTWLLSDGRILETQTDSQGRETNRSIRQISPEQLQLWQELLRQRRFSRFNQFKFTPPELKPPYSTIFLSDATATTEFTDREQYQLPADLLAILQAWERLVQRGRLPNNVLPDAPLPKP